MRTRNRIRRKTDSAQEIVSDRTVVAGGLTAGVIVALASLFWAGPERAVQKLTGLGEPPPQEPTREELVGRALRAGQNKTALELLREAADERPGSMFRLGLLASAMALTGDVIGAEVLLTDRLGPDDADSVIGFTEGDTPFGDQRVDFMEGRWWVTQEGVRGTVESTIRRVSEGRAFVEVWRSRRRGLSAVYAFDPGRSRWTRSVATNTGGLFSFSGMVDSGRLEVELRRRTGRVAVNESFRMVVAPTENGGFQRWFEERDPQGLWRKRDVYTYHPWVPLFGGFGDAMH